MTDATPVGTVRPSLYLPEGYVLANGAEVQRADYPRLEELANDYGLWTNDTAANLGLFGNGDGTTTMVLPNWIGRMAQYADVAGGTMAAGLPNIKGYFLIRSEKNWPKYAYGAFTETYISYETGVVSGNLDSAFNVYFDASKSNAVYGNSTTVQPPAINVLPILRY